MGLDLLGVRVDRKWIPGSSRDLNVKEIDKISTFSFFRAHVLEGETRKKEKKRTCLPSGTKTKIYLRTFVKFNVCQI